MSGRRKHNWVFALIIVATLLTGVGTVILFIEHVWLPLLLICCVAGIIAIDRGEAGDEGND